jgi:plastocyanin
MKLMPAILFSIVSAIAPFAMVNGDDSVVVIKEFAFIPQEITIKRGETVRWENREKRQYHSVWFESLGDEESDYIFPDEFLQRVFVKAGSFPYRCGPHPRMTGVIHVVE